ncbi:hypothetical protein CAL14_11365 [Bordetella genomosp. 9]|uniref:hypothetical protein n=1 Tax=Bordetella genomosp. 9 TaxID=1416803 RepID=UPI000A2944AB|nr:hypothetical protein [Bordetella genomosp. 9]ARP90810.1 hypothetical protein CAL14_11365 [Bordetella genomosp. 9]
MGAFTQQYGIVHPAGSAPAGPEAAGHPPRHDGASPNLGHCGRPPQTDACEAVLRVLIESGETGRLPWVMLRPRGHDGDGIFGGDFDFLIDGERFDEILRTVYSVCQEAGVSFIVRQAAPFKRQIELLDDGGRRVTLELWTQAELRVQGSRGHMTRGGVAYAAYEALDPAGRLALLAALFVLHLHHKKKDLRLALVRERLSYFANAAHGVPGLRVALDGLLSGEMDLDAARHVAMAFLNERGVPVLPPATIAARRLAWRLRRALHWPAWRTVAVVGPDGSGKSALIDDLQASPEGRGFRFKRFKRLFRKPLFYWGKEPRNVREEKRLWLVLPVAWGAFTLLQLFTGWRRPLLLDRYFYDYFVRNVRVGAGAPLRRIAAYPLCSALTPPPQRLVVASCPAQVIHTRKQEMTADAIAAMYEVYLDQVRRGMLPATLFCHTGGSREQSGLHVRRFLAASGAD